MSRQRKPVWLLLILGVLCLGGLIVSLVGLVAVVLPTTSQACQARGSLATQTVQVPPGLTAMARAIWDRPLHMVAGHWYPAGATEYYQGDGTGSGHYGSIPNPAQANLDEHPDSFAELSLLPENPANTAAGFTFADANALGNLPYMSALRVAHDGRAIIVFKRDIGYGQGPEEHTAKGFQYRVDLWRAAAEAIGVSKSEVAIELMPQSGTAQTLGQSDRAQLQQASPEEEGQGAASSRCSTLGGAVEGPLPLTPGQRAEVLPDGLAAAPADAPKAVKAMIAAGNRLYGTPYLYGGAHGVPLSQLQPAYDCSSAVSLLLYAAGVLGSEYAEDSTELESYGDPGPGKWVSIYANSEHAFIFVAGIRFDTVYAPEYDDGPNSGKPGARWRVYPGVPGWAQWVVRHPPGL